MAVTDIVRSAGNVQGILGAVTNFTQSVLSLFGVDVVGIYYNYTFYQLFQTARPVKANISRQRKVMDHPIEQGALVQDFAITLPVEIELALILNGDEYQAVYQEIKGYFLAGIPVSIQTKADVFPNMLLQGMPHEESADMFDAIPLALKLRQIQLVTVQYQALTQTQVTTPADQSTVSRGAQQPKESALYQISQFAQGLFK